MNSWSRLGIGNIVKVYWCKVYLTRTVSDCGLCWANWWLAFGMWIAWLISMGTRVILERSVYLASGQIPAALSLVRELRHRLIEGFPLEGTLCLVDQIGELLLDLESAVGVSTPTGLYGE